MHIILNYGGRGKRAHAISAGCNENDNFISQLRGLKEFFVHC